MRLQYCVEARRQQRDKKQAATNPARHASDREWGSGRDAPPTAHSSSIKNKHLRLQHEHAHSSQQTQVELEEPSSRPTWGSGSHSSIDLETPAPRNGSPRSTACVMCCPLPIRKGTPAPQEVIVSKEALLPLSCQCQSSTTHIRGLYR